MNATPIVSARGLVRRYRLGDTLVTALQDVDLDIQAGDFIALQGPSGSGKSTLINLLGLLDRPDAGSVALDGSDTARLSDDQLADVRRDRYGFVFQTFNLLPVLSAAENVAYPMTLQGMDTAAADRLALELLAAVGLPEQARVRPDLLSGGQRQRVAIARALANRPRVLFADEPTANLDSHTADRVLDLLQQLNRDQGVACVIATHDPRVVARAARRVVLRDGRAEATA